MLLCSRCKLPCYNLGQNQLRHIAKIRISAFILAKMKTVATECPFGPPLMQCRWFLDQNSFE